MARGIKTNALSSVYCNSLTGSDANGLDETFSGDLGDAANIHCVLDVVVVSLTTNVRPIDTGAKLKMI